MPVTSPFPPAISNGLNVRDESFNRFVPHTLLPGKQKHDAGEYGTATDTPLTRRARLVHGMGKSSSEG